MLTRNTICGNSNTKMGDESFLQYILNRKLSTFKRGAESTFIFPISVNFSGWEKDFDLTLSTETDRLVVDDWRLAEEPFMSDPSWIFSNIRENSNIPHQY